MSQAKFAIGQIVRHKLFDYRGVIYDVDFCFLGSDEWYQQVAASRPSKELPWYHVLVDNANYETYVAEQNLELSEALEPVKHPGIPIVFDGFKDGVYTPKVQKM